MAEKELVALGYVGFTWMGASLVQSPRAQGATLGPAVFKLPVEHSNIRLITQETMLLLARGRTQKTF